jgi:predicted site-specific integrase-resolvase
MQQAPVLLKKEAAEIARISLNALNTLVKQGKIPQVNLTSRRRGILRVDLDAYLTAQRSKGGAA